MIILCRTNEQIENVVRQYELKLLDSVFILNSIWGGVCIDTVMNEYHSREYYDYYVISYEDWYSKELSHCESFNNNF